MTTRAVMPFPVLPGKDARVIADGLKAKPDEYREDRANAGFLVERAYLQHTQMGDFVVAYWEVENSLPETFAAAANPKTDLGRWFMEQVKEIHGFDITQPPSQLPELVGEWIDPDVNEMRQGFAFCAPVLPDQIDYGRDWSRRTFASEGMTASRRNLGQNKEIAMVTYTEQGPICAVYIEGNDPEEANRRLTQSQDPFDVEFRENLRRIFPPFVNFDEPVPGVTEIFDSEKLEGAQLTGRARQAAQAPNAG